jgi:hypothetical protein
VIVSKSSEFDFRHVSDITILVSSISR